MSNRRDQRPCLFCGDLTRSIYQVCAAHYSLLAEDYRYVRSLALDGPSATDLHSRAIERDAVTPTKGTED